VAGGVEVVLEDTEVGRVAFGNVNVGDPDASVQNRRARSSSVNSSDGQFDRIHPTTSLGKPGLIMIKSQ